MCDGRHREELDRQRRDGERVFVIVLDEILHDTSVAFCEDARKLPLGLKLHEKSRDQEVVHLGPGGLPQNGVMPGKKKRNIPVGIKELIYKKKRAFPSSLPQNGLE